MVENMASDGASSGKASGTDRAQDRRICWQLAQELGGRAASVWAIEFLKAAQVRTEQSPGLLRQFSGVATTTVERLRRTLLFWLAAMTAGLLYLGYAMKVTALRVPCRIPQTAKRAIAVHGEWSTRTRHLLTALSDTKPRVDFAILLGRIPSSTKQVESIWVSHQVDLGELLLLVPFSWKSVFTSSRRIPPLLREGAKCLQRAPLALSPREVVAVSFRILNGLVASEWWRSQVDSPLHDVIFGITGTADTTLLERAMHDSGTKTVHAIHGQATGPNFFGVSDLAIFRTGYDADRYKSLGCYARCHVQATECPNRAAAEMAILVLTNLTHPANPEFQKRAQEGDVAVLQLVSQALERMGSVNLQKLWKPHPVINSVHYSVGQKLRNKAQELGYREIREDQEVSSLISSAHWVLSTPSTVLVDLLANGVVGYLIDPYQTVTDEAISQFPSLRSDLTAVAQRLAEVTDEEVSKNELEKLFNAIQPAKPLTLMSIN